MAPDTETEFEQDNDAEEQLEATGDELEERIGDLDEHIDEARQGLRARSEEADDEDWEDDSDDDGGDDPLAFDDPEDDDEDDD